jgi:nucleotide sugar dehydrogenase
MYTVGIIGNGFVGSAVASAYALHAHVCVYDADDKKSLHTLEEVLNCEFIFVCVPTPMNLENGNKIDLSIVRDVFRRASPANPNSIFILKSTVLPGTTELLAQEFPDFEIVFNPEFLTERSARLDFINASRIIIGGSADACDRVRALYRDRFQHTPIISTDSTSAEFIKYMCNCFFATKISYMNEMKQAADQLGLDWPNIMCGFLSDGRVGNSHVDVPGHDGNHGFGGKCFPKDINAFINFFKSIDIDPTMLMAAWQKNIEVRENADWEEIEGATSRRKA